ncbi:hypothetical protein [Phenylobacterium sp.]|uniref:hypothetical protein n=1 Tax=Phenylobacterium sp. TaxID=1871053 RepID=UPI003561564C
MLGNETTQRANRRGVMTRFEYVAIFYGIVVAMAIETVLASLHRLIAAGKRVRWHWMAPATAVNASLVTLAQFWILWGDRDQWTGNFSFFQFLPFGISLFFMFLSAAATLPDEVGAEGVDLKVFYFHNRKHYWGLVAAYFAYNILLNFISLARSGPTDIWFHNLRWLVGDFVALGIAVPLIFFRAYWVHVIGIAMALAALLFFLNSIQLS